MDETSINARDCAAIMEGRNILASYRQQRRASFGSRRQAINATTTTPHVDASSSPPTSKDAAGQLDELCEMARNISQQIKMATTPGTAEPVAKRLDVVPQSATTEVAGGQREGGMAYVVVELTRALSKATTCRDRHVSKLEGENRMLRKRVSDLEKQLDELAFSFDALTLCLGGGGADLLLNQEQRHEQQNPGTTATTAKEKQQRI